MKLLIRLGAPCGSVRAPVAVGGMSSLYLGLAPSHANGEFSVDRSVLVANSGCREIGSQVGKAERKGIRWKRTAVANSLCISGMSGYVGCLVKSSESRVGTSLFVEEHVGRDIF